MQSGLRSMESNHKSIVVLRCKVLVVGDACVGKSALTQVFQSNGATYPKNYLMTIGAEFCVKQVPIPETNVVVELFIYDCAGQSIFNQLDLNAKYYEDAAAVLVVYSVISRETLQSCSRWYSAVKSSIQGNQLIGALVGNKAEYRDGTVDSRAEVTLEEARQMSLNLNLPYFETSAAQNLGVEDTFQFIAEEFHKKYEENVQNGGGASGFDGVRK